MHTANTYRDQRMRQVVADKRLRTMEHHFKLSGPKRGRGRLQRWSFTRGSNCKSLAGKVLVFWIGGRLWLRLYHTLKIQKIWAY